MLYPCHSLNYDQRDLDAILVRTQARNAYMYMNEYMVISYLVQFKVIEMCQSIGNMITPKYNY